MTNMRAEGAYQRAVGAFKNPMLDLLHGRYAAFVVAALSLVFTADRPTVPIDDAHAEVGEIVDELRAAGYDETEKSLPSGGGREICRYWVRVGWIIPQIQEGAEIYRLSAQAIGALEIAGRAGGSTRVSRSRVRTLLNAVDQLAHSAESDPQRRIANLLAEKETLEAEIAALENEGMEPLDDEQLLEEAENVLHLSQELPADFSRVAESINAMQRDVVADLRRDIRPTGEILREYLRRGQHVMQSTREGRAFSGALRLIGDPEQIDALTSRLQSILMQPFIIGMDDDQRNELAAIAKRVEQGVNEVLSAQRRASHVITAQVRTHDPIRDREVDELLREVMSGLQQWMQHSHSRDKVTPLRSLPTLAVQHLRQTVKDPRPVDAPVKLSDEMEEPQFLDEDNRLWGGPHYSELEAYAASLGEEFDLATAFQEAQDEAIRRPVDLLGLLEIAHRNSITEHESVSYVEGVRPDGTSRTFAFAAMTVHSTKELADD